MLKNKENDEHYTPVELAVHMAKLIPDNLKGCTIWNPFATINDPITKALEDEGFQVLSSGFQLSGDDFFNGAEEIVVLYNIKMVVTNIPFSKKLEIIKKLKELKLPLMTPMPSRAIGGIEMYDNLIAMTKIEQVFGLTNFNIVLLPKRVPYSYRNNNLEPSFILSQIPLKQDRRVGELHVIEDFDVEITSEKVRAIIKRRCNLCNGIFKFCQCCKQRVSGDVCSCIEGHPNLSEKKWCSLSSDRNGVGLFCDTCHIPYNVDMPTEMIMELRYKGYEPVEAVGDDMPNDMPADSTYTVVATFDSKFYVSCNVFKNCYVNHKTIKEYGVKAIISKMTPLVD